MLRLRKYLSIQNTMELLPQQRRDESVDVDTFKVMCFGDYVVFILFILPLDF